LEYNEKVNEGREISVVEFLKRIEPSSDFMKQYETQRHMRRAFMEEFKIHSYNYILLLLESVMRILTTSIKDHFDDDEDAKNPKKKKDKINFMSKNYKRFLENRQKKIDKFIVNCIGWNHVNRCIEVLDMTIRDLVHKIVPTKVVIRELKTSSGKVLTKDSEYTLVEKKKVVTVGKKTHVDYVFELDLKEDEQKLKEEEEDKRKELQTKRENIFYMNLEDFNVFKLKAVVFLLQQPINFTQLIVNLWYKLLPSQTYTRRQDQDDLSRQEQEEIAATRNSIRQFVNSVVQHLKELLDYLLQVKDEKTWKRQFELLMQN